MTTNAIAISRSFVEAGIDKKAADAIAEAMVTHSNDTFATKAGIANLATKADIAQLSSKVSQIEGEVKAMAGQIKLLTNLVVGLCIAIAIFFLSQIIG